MTETKNHFRQRVPRFVDIDNFIEFDFDTTEELINHSFIQNWLNTCPSSILVKSHEVLMVVYNDGFNWWGIGFISNPDDLELPEWDDEKYIGQHSDGTIEIFDKNSENPVISSRGDVLTLKDGTECKNIEYEDWYKMNNKMYAYTGCEDPYKQPPGKYIKPYALQEGDKFRLPTLKMLDEDFRCWWWNSFDKCWEYKFRIMIGTPALDENDYIIDKPIGFDKDSQRQIYHKDSALKLIAKGITHFIPYIPDCPPLILCDPLDFDKLTEMRTLEELAQGHSMFQCL